MPDLFRLNAIVSIGTANALSALRQIDAQGRVTAASMGKVVSSAAALTGAISNIAGLVAMAKSFAAITTLAGEFELKLQSIRTVVSQNGESVADAAKQYKDYHDSILDLAASIGKMPAELAAASYELGSSGFEKADENMEMLRISAMAATAGLSDTQTAASALISVLNSYTKESEDAAHVNDVMFQTMRYGILQYKDLARYIGNVVPISASAGISFEEVSASLASITKAGLNASKATIGLRGAILKLLNNTERGKNTLANYGLEVNATTLKEKGLIRTLQEIDAAIGSNTDTWAKIISDNRALTATLALVRNGGMEAVEFLGYMEKASEGAGRGTEAYNKIANTFAHQMDLLAAEWQKFLIILGEDFLPVLRSVIEGTAGFIKVLNSIPSDVRTAGAALVALGAGAIAINSLRNAFTLASLAMRQYTVSAAEAAATSDAVAAAAVQASGAVTTAAATQGVAQMAATPSGATAAAVSSLSTIGAVVGGPAGLAASSLGAIPPSPVSLPSVAADVSPALASEVVDVGAALAQQEQATLAAMDDMTAAAGKTVAASAAQSADEVADFVKLVAEIPEGSSDAAKALSAMGNDVVASAAQQASKMGDLVTVLDNLPEGAATASTAMKDMAGEVAKSAARQVDDITALLSLLDDVPVDSRKAVIESSAVLQNALKAQGDAVKGVVSDLSAFAASAPTRGLFQIDDDAVDNINAASDAADDAVRKFSKSLETLPSGANKTKGALLQMGAAVEKTVKDNSSSVDDLLETVGAGLANNNAKQRKYLEGVIDNTKKIGESIASSGDDVTVLTGLIGELPDVSKQATDAAKEMADEIGKAAVKNADDVARLADSLGDLAVAGAEARRIPLGSAPVVGTVKAVDAAGDVAVGAGGVAEAGAAAASLKASNDAAKAAKAAESAVKGLGRQQVIVTKAIEGTGKAAKDLFPTFRSLGASAKSAGTAVVGWGPTLAGAGLAIGKYILSPIVALRAAVTWFTATAIPAIQAGLATVVPSLGPIVAIGVTLGLVATKISEIQEMGMSAEKGLSEAADQEHRWAMGLFSVLRDFKDKGPAAILAMGKSAEELTHSLAEARAGIDNLRVVARRMGKEGAPFSQVSHIQDIAAQGEKMIEPLTKARDVQRSIEDARSKDAKKAAEDQRLYIQNLERSLDLLKKLKEAYDRGEFATAADAQKALDKLPANYGIRQKDPSKYTPIEQDVAKAGGGLQSAINKEEFDNAISAMQISLTKMDEGIKVRREQARGSLREEMEFYARARAESIRLEAEAVSKAGVNQRAITDAHKKFHMIRVDIMRREHEARKFYAKDLLRILDAQIKALQAEVNLSSQMLKDAMKSSKNLITDEKDILALIDRKEKAELALIAAQEKRDLIEARRRGASSDEIKAIATEAQIKRLGVLEAKKEAILTLDTRQAEQLKRQGDLRVKAMGGQISAIDDAIDRMQEVEEGESVNIDAVERLMKKRLELTLASIEEEKKGALDVARAREATETEIADIIQDAELQKQESIRDTANQLRELNKEAKKSKRENHLGEIYQGIDAMLEATELEKKEREERSKAFFGDKKKKGGSASSLISDIEREADKYLRDAGISERTGLRGSIGVDAWSSTIGKPQKGDTSSRARQGLKIQEAPKDIIQDAVAGGVNMQEVLVNVKFDVNGKVSVASDALSEGTALAVIDDLSFADRFGGKGGNGFGRTQV